jgi:hypothetical protein
VRAGRDLHVIDGLTVTKMSNEGGDYATVLGTLCIASGQHTWNVYINHVEDSNLFIGVTVGGHDLNADPQEMKSRTYYLSNGTIRVAGKLVTRCAEPYAEGDLVTVQLDMEAHHISFYKNGVLQGAGAELPGGWCGLTRCVGARTAATALHQQRSSGPLSGLCADWHAPRCCPAHTCCSALRGGVALCVAGQHHGQHHAAQQQHVPGPRPQPEVERRQVLPVDPDQRGGHHSQPQAARAV